MQEATIKKQRTSLSKKLVPVQRAVCREENTGMFPNVSSKLPVGRREGPAAVHLLGASVEVVGRQVAAGAGEGPGLLHSRPLRRTTSPCFCLSTYKIKTRKVPFLLNLLKVFTENNLYFLKKLLWHYKE